MSIYWYIGIRLSFNNIIIFHPFVCQFESSILTSYLYVEAYNDVLYQMLKSTTSVATLWQNLTVFPRKYIQLNVWTMPSTLINCSSICMRQWQHRISNNILSSLRVPIIFNKVWLNFSHCPIPTG